MKRSVGPVVVFVAADALALVAYAAFLVVLPWLVLARTGSAATTAAVAGVSAVPVVLSAVVGGRLVDRYGRRRIGVATTATCAVAAAAFGAVDGTVGLSTGWLIALGLLANLAITPSQTARDALMGTVSTASGVALERVAGVRQVVFGLSLLAGPSAAGLLLAVAPAALPMWLIAGCWALATLLTAALPAPAPRTGVDEEGTGPGRSLGGLLRGRRPLWAVLVIAFGSSVITEPVTGVILPAHFRAVAAPQLYGLAMAVFALGSVLGSITYAVVAVRAPRVLFLVAFALVTVCFGVFALLPAFWLLASALLVGGVGSGLVSPLLLVAVTTQTAEHERGRVLGLYQGLSVGASPIGLGLLSLVLLHAPLRVGAEAVFVVWLVVAVFALTQVGALTAARVRGSQREHTHADH